jgi:hypothetical protein
VVHLYPYYKMPLSNKQMFKKMLYPARNISQLATLTTQDCMEKLRLRCGNKTFKYSHKVLILYEKCRPVGNTVDEGEIASEIERMRYRGGLSSSVICHIAT